MAPRVEAIVPSVWLGEGPHWDHEEQALYFISVFDSTIDKYVPDTKKHTRAKLADNPSFIIPIEGKRHHFAVGLNRKVVEVQWAGEEDGARVLRTIAQLGDDDPVSKFNDGKADPRGRLFVGTMGEHYEPGKMHMCKGSIFRIDPDGSMHRQDSSIDLSNGLCWDLNQKAFYFIDTLEFAVRRYDYDDETGNISNSKKIFVFKENQLEGGPDGMTIDTDGNLWIANFNGNRVLKVDPRTGKLLQKVLIPVTQVTSVTFGGPQLDILYVTTARMDLGEELHPPNGTTYKVTGLGVKGHLNRCVKFQ